MDDHQGGPIAWREAGPRNGDAILFLHGLGTTRTGWDLQLADFSDRWRSIAWDMPGYGASPLPEQPMTFEFIADAVVSLLDTIGEESAHLVGLSFGGMHALHTALRHADRVRTLTLVDTSPAFGADGVTTRDQWVSDRLEAIDSGATPADIATAVMTGIAAPGFNGPGYDLAVASMGRIDAAGLRAAVNLLPDHEVTAQLGTITVPTLVVVGELDEETPPAYAQALANGIAGSEYLEVPGAGHLTPLEAPATFNAALRSFLTRERPAA